MNLSPLAGASFLSCNQLPTQASDTQMLLNTPVSPEISRTIENIPPEKIFAFIQTAFNAKKVLEIEACLRRFPFLKFPFGNNQNLAKSSFFYASSKGCTVLLKQLLNYFPGLLYQNVELLNDNIIDQHAADLSQYDKKVFSNSFTGFSIAAYSGQTEVIKLFLLYDFDLTLNPLDTSIALYAAARRGHNEIVEILLKARVRNDASFNINPILAAATGGHNRVLQTLLTQADGQISDIHTAYIEALTTGQPELVAVLQPYFDTALTMAFNAKNVMEIETCLRRLPGIQFPFNDDKPSAKSCFFYAASKGCTVFLEQLLKHFPELLYQNVKLLNNAIFDQHAADLRPQDKAFLSNSFTAFSIAAYSGQTEVINVLFQHGFDLTHNPSDTFIARCAAASRGHREIVEILDEVAVN